MSRLRGLTLGVPNYGGGGGLLDTLRSYINRDGGVAWFGQERTGSGATAEAYNSAISALSIEASSAFPKLELVTNGDFSAWTGDDPDNWSLSGFTEDANNYITEANGGARFVSDGTYIALAQNVGAVSGRRYRVEFDITDVNSGGVKIGLGTSVSGAFSTVGHHIFEAVTTTASISIARNAGATDLVIGNVSVREVNPLNGTYNGVTLAQPGPAGLVAPSYDGINDYTNRYSTTLNSLLNPSAGLAGVGCKVSGSGVWTDNARRVLTMYYVDANNYISIEKNTSNQLEWNYVAGGTAETVTLATTPSGYFYAALKWDTATYGMRALYNGVQTGSDQAIAGTWTGNLASTGAVIGAASTTPANVWSGYLLLDHLLRDDPADSEILNLARQMGVA